MKTRATIGTCLVLLFSPAAAIAADGPYISGQLGASWLTNADFGGNAPGIRLRSEVEFDTGLHLGAAVGYEFGDFRVEGEFGYQSHEFEKMKDIVLNGTPLSGRGADGDIDAFIFLINGFYDIDTGTKLTPYLGGGIGFVSIDIDDLFVAGIVRGNDDDIEFAYQLAGGIAYEITEQIAADLSYRFVAASEPDLAGLDDYISHNLVAAIRFSFR